MHRTAFSSSSSSPSAKQTTADSSQTRRPPPILPPGRLKRRICPLLRARALHALPRRSTQHQRRRAGGQGERERERQSLGGWGNENETRQRGEMEEERSETRPRDQRRLKNGVNLPGARGGRPMGDKGRVDGADRASGGDLTAPHRARLCIALLRVGSARTARHGHGLHAVGGVGSDLVSQTWFLNLEFRIHVLESSSKSPNR